MPGEISGEYFPLLFPNQFGRVREKENIPPRRRHGCMVLGGVLFTIFQAYTMSNMLLEKQLRVDLRLYFLLGALLSYIYTLLSAMILLYSYYLMISDICRAKKSLRDGELAMSLRHQNFITPK